MAHRLFPSLVALALATGCRSAANVDASLLVPQRATAPVLDGTAEEAEWSEALAFALGERTELRAQLDGERLHLALRPRDEGPLILTFHIAHEDEVRVLHASYSLGEATYERGADGLWMRRADFEWDARAAEAGTPGAEARAKYLDEHGWTATPIEVGRLGDIELALSLADLAKWTTRVETGAGAFAELRFSVAVYDLGAEGPGPTLPSLLEDEAAKAELQLGDAPESLTLDPEHWSTVRWRLGSLDSRRSQGS
jgi:hypothetical protein